MGSLNLYVQQARKALESQLQVLKQEVITATANWEAHQEESVNPPPIAGAFPTTSHSVDLSALNPDLRPKEKEKGKEKKHHRKTGSVASSHEKEKVKDEKDIISPRNASIPPKRQDTLRKIGSHSQLLSLGKGDAVGVVVENSINEPYMPGVDVASINSELSNPDNKNGGGKGSATTKKTSVGSAPSTSPIRESLLDSGSDPVQKPTKSKSSRKASKRNKKKVKKEKKADSKEETTLVVVVADEEDQSSSATDEDAAAPSPFSSLPPSPLPLPLSSIKSARKDHRSSAPEGPSHEKTISTSQPPSSSSSSHGMDEDRQLESHRTGAVAAYSTSTKRTVRSHSSSSRAHKHNQLILPPLRVDTDAATTATATASFAAASPPNLSSVLMATAHDSPPAPSPRRAMSMHIPMGMFFFIPLVRDFIQVRAASGVLERSMKQRGLE